MVITLIYKLKRKHKERYPPKIFHPKDNCKNCSKGSPCFFYVTTNTIIVSVRVIKTIFWKDIDLLLVQEIRIAECF